MTVVQHLREALSVGGIGMVVGPKRLGTILKSKGWYFDQFPVENLPTFTMHKTLLPKAVLKPGLSLFLGRPQP